MATPNSISIFFPAYNEEKNIRKTISETVKVLEPLNITYEVIIVDDGSKDGTAKIVQDEASRNPKIRLVSHNQNKGYGDALRSGINASRYEYIFFSDSDLQFDLGEITLLFEHIPRYDVVIGYRKKRQDHFLRLVNAKMWNIANRILFGLKVKDIDCAFKLFKSDLIKKIKLNSGGAMLSAEMLLKLKDQGAQIKELPVTHLPRKQGNPTGAKVSVIFRAFMEMWHLYSVEMGEKTQIQFIKFAIVGVANTLTVLVVYITLTRSFTVFEEHYLRSEALAYTFGTIVSFIFNRQWTFRKYLKVNISEVARFYTTVGSALVFNVFVVYIFVDIFKWNDILSVIISAIFTVAWNFILSKYWVFRKKNQGL